MEPIGTITQYFSFVDEKTKDILEKIMIEALDYYDFVLKLDDLVLRTESPIMVVYLAIHHSILAYEYKLIDKIREKYGHHQILGPNLFFASAYQGAYEDVKKVHELADAILAAQPEDWIALEMLLLKFEADMRAYPTTIYQTSTVDEIQKRIECNPEFGFYETVLNDNLEIRATADGDSEERIRCLDRGLQIAEKFDDKLSFTHLLIRKANLIMNYNRKESKELLEKAYSIVDKWLGIPINFADIITYLSILRAIRGEFDTAIEGFLKAVTIRERAGLNSGNPSYYLSTFYNLIGEPESGLEWGRMAEDQFRSRPHLVNRAILNQAWSLIILDRATEAQILIDTINESILKSGDESQLAWLHFVTGILEIDNGDISSALDSIEQALRIYERPGTAILMELIFLYQLAKVEVLSRNSEEVLSPSLALLEERAISEDLPGYLGEVLLLKADIAIANNDDALLREIIPQIRSLSENEDLKFLKIRFESLQNKL